MNETGFQSNTTTEATDRDTILAAYVGWIEELGRLPSAGEIWLKHRLDRRFPRLRAISPHFATRADLARALLEYAIRTNAAWAAKNILRAALAKARAPARDGSL